jgi:hypothetical protein
MGGVYTDVGLTIGRWNMWQGNRLRCFKRLEQKVRK